VGFLSISFALVVGCFLGLIAGYYGGWADMLIMRVIDILLALPGFLLALSIVAALGPGLENVIMAIGVSYIPSFARMMRSAVLSTRELDYVDAAQALGASDWRIILLHILPNSLSPIIVLTTLSMAGAILSAAGLSFLGMGAQPPTPEWGSMISTSRPFIRVSHWAVTIPGLAIFITVMCLNLVGDGLRDALDPRLKNLG
jgi:peptide/nickel transport system permease protein